MTVISLVTFVSSFCLLISAICLVVFRDKISPTVRIKTIHADMAVFQPFDGSDIIRTPFQTQIDDGIRLNLMHTSVIVSTYQDKYGEYWIPTVYTDDNQFTVGKSCEVSLKLKKLKVVLADGRGNENLYDFNKS
ncbi:MAG: hypothetical protein UW68_C0054G0003 [Candidatus Collierbacteria bacterium GW2011_GWB1_44_6]|uniref:Uncharacterized protein n=2 Tax=Candidatus Collieribacteriota TaxID=1752725 RepID=A0A0G1JKE3_9BACT|nr:MAG: hypothetical protein UV68_C0007G0016 [Candidatus Collierbacteria bacterium GW2011_GWC2_43_12]KKT71853.1 MAG: hypothetical protein UW68_C0054G0003 [Candidatus Collierbacteria bacterium GW2011_GWB1_44_6]KKT83118.1 MAG: hypothetical protein UW80_C0021G0008 [Microgenomates group bacterium GW2011_GWC1_44_9]